MVRRGQDSPMDQLVVFSCAASQGKMQQRREKKHIQYGVDPVRPCGGDGSYGKHGSHCELFFFFVLVFFLFTCVVYVLFLSIG